MFKIFDMTRDQLKKYTDGSDGLYNQTVEKWKNLRTGIAGTRKNLTDAWKLVKK